MTIKRIKNENGPTLEYSDKSGLTILKKGDLYFKDHNRSGKLEKFEDWRLSPQIRAKDLAQRLSIKDIAGLMLFTAHLAIPSIGTRSQKYHGKSFEDSGSDASDLSDLEKEYFLKNKIKHTLITKISSPEVAAKWNNNVQELSESMPWAIPIVNSSDPRHGYKANTEFNEASGQGTSQWPESIGMAATFDPKLVREFGEIASAEYRAMGLTMILGPQVDLATEPRWMRFNGTFGESAKLTRDMGAAFIQGFQMSNNKDWGQQSVSTMAKHWPGGGVIEGGRDAHFAYGKYGVYPKKNMGYQLKSFEAVIDKHKKDFEQTAGIMPYYSVSYDFDIRKHENVGNAYSRYLITDLLRKKYGYDKIVCTDWCITNDEPTNVLDVLSGDQCWGVEDQYTVPERHLRLLMAGIDQFGGNKDPEPIIWAYHKMCKIMGKPWAVKRFQESAKRILLNMFQLGLFENPYVDPEKAGKIVGKQQFVEAGIKAQEKSIIMLKNKKEILPIKNKASLYIPKRRYPEQIGWYLSKISAHSDYPLDLKKASSFFDVVSNPLEADLALVKIKSPERAFIKYNGYDPKRVDENDNGYLPISLQYRPYLAKLGRKKSLAGDRRKGHTLNRTYNGKSTDTLNESDLDLIINTKKRMKDKPVIVSIDTANPFVLAEIEPYVDVILIDFGISDEVLFKVLTGEYEPSALLPFQMPKNMETVETQSEDTAFDMEPYIDEEGQTYDFGFGLNFSGVISDKRTKKYLKD
ncbi:glycoside hydrolase family 3 N-terminal domain-containing protein [Pediococcus siamensis]|uniref:glycoside hydrolase family 3 protein n=1 Tax=Pediococcus siamensis TaxID=381829 RepID=UPI0039A0CE2D